MLPPLERARYFELLIKKEGMSATEIAKHIKKSLPFVSNTLRLLKLPPIIQDALANQMISEGHARALLTISDHDKTVAIYKKVLIEEKNVRETEELARLANAV